MLKRYGRIVTGMCVLALTWANYASAITRDKVIANAETYENHRWQVRKGNPNSYYNFFKGMEGQWITGVSYNYGGYESIAAFDAKIAKGVTAGNNYSARGIHRDFAGVDCSGFVSKTWEVSYHTTKMLPNISHSVSWADLKAGDIVNRYRTTSRHVRLFHQFTSDGRLWVYESTPGTNRTTGGYEKPDTGYYPKGRVIHRIVPREASTSKTVGYDPMRYKNIKDVVKTVTVTIVKAGKGSGAVNGPGISCGTDCTEKYTVGTVLNLQATPDQNSKFAGCLLNGKAVSCSIAVNADSTITAIFNQIIPTPSMKTLYRLCLGACNGGTTWSNHMDSGSTNESGFTCQRRLGQLLETQVPGTKPLYRIVRYRDTSGRDIKDDHLTSDTLSELVSGSTNEGIMGYVYTTQVSGAIPLYRKYRTYYYTIYGGQSLLHTDHITTTDMNEGSSSGWVNEDRVLGYIMGPAASSCP